MRNSRKGGLMLVAPSIEPSRYSSGSRTSMTTTASRLSSRFLSSAGGCSGMTCRASPSISFSVFMRSLLGTVASLESAGSYYHHSRSEQGRMPPPLSEPGQDCYNRPRNERVNPLARARNAAPPHHVHLGQPAGPGGQQAHPLLWDRGAGGFRHPRDRHRGRRDPPGDP